MSRRLPGAWGWRWNLPLFPRRRCGCLKFHLGDEPRQRKLPMASEEEEDDLMTRELDAANELRRIANSFSRESILPWPMSLLTKTVIVRAVGRLTKNIKLDPRFLVESRSIAREERCVGHPRQNSKKLHK